MSASALCKPVRQVTRPYLIDPDLSPIRQPNGYQMPVPCSFHVETAVIGGMEVRPW